MSEARTSYMTVRMVAREPNTEFGTDVLGLYERSDGKGRSLVFDLAHHFSDQDRALGHDAYSLSLESGATDYASVAICEVSSQSVHLHLEAQSAARLGLPADLVLELDLDAGGRAEVVRGLRAILGGGGRPAAIRIAG